MSMRGKLEGEMSRHGITKLTNEYVEVLGDLYDKTPKAVLAAIAVSALTNGGDELDEAQARLLAEWGALHANGIVPQPLRAAMMQRFKAWEARGKQCVLLYCGDFDPVGLKISDALRDNMEELSGQVGWHPDHVRIDRFGLNLDFINEQGLDWIDGLITGSKKDLGDPSHKHHHFGYVQEYIRQHGKRKVEANAMVIRPEASRALFRDTILRYLSTDAPTQYWESLRPIREQVRVEVMHLLQDMAQS
jgi:hypothetical protein